MYLGKWSFSSKASGYQRHQFYLIFFYKNVSTFKKEEKIGTFYNFFFLIRLKTYGIILNLTIKISLKLELTLIYMYLHSKIPQTIKIRLKSRDTVIPITGKMEHDEL